jgi:hypothetical protein
MHRLTPAAPYRGITRVRHARPRSCGANSLGEPLAAGRRRGRGRRMRKGRCANCPSGRAGSLRWRPNPARQARSGDTHLPIFFAGKGREGAPILREPRPTHANPLSASTRLPDAIAHGDSLVVEVSPAQLVGVELHPKLAFEGRNVLRNGRPSGNTRGEPSGYSALRSDQNRWLP